MKQFLFWLFRNNNLSVLEIQNQIVLYSKLI